jgi:hypothetical protein
MVKRIYTGGGVGVGIESATGTTLAGIQKDRYIDNQS